MNLLCNFENIFTYNGQLKHEIVYLYDIKLAGNEIYCLDKVEVKDQEHSRFAEWIAYKDFNKYIIYPPQILKFIKIS